jgi:hypothetical protein
MLGKYKLGARTSHRHSFSDAQNVTTPSVNTAKTSLTPKIGWKYSLQMQLPTGIKQLKS